MGEQPTDSSTPPTFEQAMSRLESIVEEMENGRLPLEDLVARFDEGVRLSEVCNRRLDEAQRKIEMITTASDGNLQSEPFDAEDVSARPENAEVNPSGNEPNPSSEDPDEISLF